MWDAVVVAGGRGERLGGQDKPAIELSGRTLLDIALDAVAAARATVVVGPSRPVGARTVRWTREEPAGGGPLAALAAGLRALPPGADVIVVLAADLPAVNDGTVRALIHAVAGDGAVAVDPSGRPQPLLAAYRAPTLVRALTSIGEPHGQPMHRLLGALSFVTLDVGSAADDIDTPGDLARWQEGRW